MRFCAVVAAALAGVALAAGAEPASAACSIGKLPIPVTMRGMQPTVLAKVNGREVRFILDSGAFYNGISAHFADEQKMRPAQARSVTGSHVAGHVEADFSGVAGAHKISTVVQADKFQFADADLGQAVFMTLPLDSGGLLGQNFLKIADVEYDFRNGSIFMVKPQGCKSEDLLYWATGPYSMLSLEPDHGGDHTIATVLVNGHKMKAMFDTGAGRTFITQRAAARAGVKVTDPDVKAGGGARGVEGVAIKTWSAHFASVKMDTEEIHNGVLEIGDTDADSFDVLIGADFFLTHHVYVANSRGEIYFTHNGGSGFSAGPGPAQNGVEKKN